MLVVVVVALVVVVVVVVVVVGAFSECAGPPGVKVKVPASFVFKLFICVQALHLCSSSSFVFICHSPAHCSLHNADNAQIAKPVSFSRAAERPCGELQDGAANG